jgi:hypothetical protein
MYAHPTGPFPADLYDEQRAKSAPPEPNRFMANVDAAFMQKIFHIPQRGGKPQIHHNGQANDLWASLEVTKGETFWLPATRIARPARLKKSSSDSSAAGAGTEGRAPTHMSFDA